MSKRLTVKDIQMIEICVREIHAASSIQNVSQPVSIRIRKELASIREICGKVLVGPDKHGRLFTQKYANENMEISWDLPQLTLKMKDDSIPEISS